MFFISLGVEAPQEIDRFQIFASAIAVGNPLSLFARIVQVEHGRHSIHSQPVNMVFVEPEQSARHQEAAYFIPTVVKDVGLPVRMKPLSRICMLKQMGAVEIGESVRIRREVRRYPVENDSDSLLVQKVHQVHEVLRRTVARGWSKISRRLISPGSKEGMFHDGKQLDMGKSEMLHIFRQPRRDLAVS